MIKVILWDIDATLLDFLAAEKAAIRFCFEKYGLGQCSDEMLKRYSTINKGAERVVHRRKSSPTHPSTSCILRRDWQLQPFRAYQLLELIGSNSRDPRASCKYATS